MAQTITQWQKDNIRLSAELANFAYAAGNPLMKTSIDNMIAQKKELPRNFAKLLPNHEVIGFERYNSNTWFVKWFAEKHRWLQSTSYFCHLRSPGESDKIFVGFRGTWNHLVVRSEDVKENGM